MNTNTDARVGRRSLHPSRVLTHTFAVLAVVAIALSSMGVSAVPKGPSEWRDEFAHADIDPAWYWVNENTDRWSLAGDGFMRLGVSTTPTGGENLLLRSGAQGTFTIETHLLFEPTANFQFAGLVIYQDESNFVQFGRAFAWDPENCANCVGNGIYFDNWQAGALVGGNFATATAALGEAYLRLEVKGSKVTAFYSGDGQAWQKIGQHTLPSKFQVTGLGLTASQDYFRPPEDPVPIAEFDYFAIAGKLKPSSPFMGGWTAFDYYDATEIHVIVDRPSGGRPSGPFHVTWTEDYISFCNGGPGLAKGTGWLAEGDPNLLEATLRLECSDSGESIDFDVDWRFDPATQTLTWTDWNSVTLTWHRSSLIKAAQREGALNVIALPIDWCNYGAIIQGYGDTYGIPVNSVAPEAGSAEELQAIRDGGPDAPDVIDVGPGFAVQAKDEGLIAPYRVTAWNTIPDVMKDSEAFWYGDYYGLMAIAANTDFTPVPATWQDLRLTDYAPAALGGDPRISNMAFFTVYGAALANGGGLEDIEPGLRFFKELDEAGRLLPDTGNGDTLASGQTPILPEWSYLALAQRDATPSIELAIPTDGAIASFYAQAISANALHPNAARLWMEYLYSDVGQLAFLQGYCYPARFGSLYQRGDVIPPDMLEGLPDPTGAAFPTVDQIEAAKEFVDENCDAYGCAPRYPRFVASVAGDFLWTTEFIPGASLTITVYGSLDKEQPPLWQDGRDADPSGFAFVEFRVVAFDLQPGFYVTVADSLTEKGLELQYIAVDVFDTANDVMAGTAPPDTDVWVAAGPQEWQTGMLVRSDPLTGEWTADFKTLNPAFDITEEMRSWSYAQLFDEDGDINEGDPPPPPPNPTFLVIPASEEILGYGWPVGSEVFLTINGVPFPTKTATVGPAPWNPDDINAYFNLRSSDDYEGYDLKTDDVVVLSGSGIDRTHVVRDIAIAGVDVDDTVIGTAAPWEVVHAWVHGYGDQEVDGTVGNDRTWTADFAAIDFSLSEGMDGRAEIRDEQGNSTAAEWHVKESPTRFWFGAFTGDLPVDYWSEGSHTYKFDFMYSVPYYKEYPGVTLTDLSVSSSFELQTGLLLLRRGRQQAKVGDACIDVGGINPSQPTRFYIGWIADELMTYDEAVAHFVSIVGMATWDEGAGSLTLTYKEILPNGSVPADYACSFTSP